MILVTGAIGPLRAGTMYHNVSPASPYWMGALILLVACLLPACLKVKSQAQTRSDSRQNMFFVAD